MYTANPDPTTTVMHTPKSSQATRIAAMLGGGVLVLLGLGLAVAGIGAFAIFGGDGRAATSNHDLSTRTAALVSPRIAVGSAKEIEDFTGDLRIGTSARANGGKAVFVGIAREADVDRYLSGTRTEVTHDGDLSPFRFHRDIRDGARHTARGRPGDRHFWIASSTSTRNGRAVVDWTVRSGHYRTVIMNADGTPGVHAEGAFRMKVPHLTTLAIVALSGGLVLLMTGGLIVFAFSREPRRTTRAPRPVAAPAAS